MKWSDLPMHFVEWVENHKITEYKKAIEIIANSTKKVVNKSRDGDEVFLKLIKNIRTWSPARRRNNEEAYKIELRGHLQSAGYTLNEEYGESRYGLLVHQKYAIEIKKDPNLGEYDRLFGQLARHLQHQHKVIVLILEATRGDHYDNFTALVDRFLNIGDSSVDIIKK